MFLIKLKLSFQTRASTYMESNDSEKSWGVGLAAVETYKHCQRILAPRGRRPLHDNHRGTQGGNLE